MHALNIQQTTKMLKRLVIKHLQYSRCKTANNTIHTVTQNNKIHCCSNTFVLIM